MFEERGNNKLSKNPGSRPARAWEFLNVARQVLFYCHLTASATTTAPVAVQQDTLIVLLPAFME